MNEIEQRARKALSGAGIPVPTIAAVATQEVIAAEAFPEVVVVSGAAVVDANGTEREVPKVEVTPCGGRGRSEGRESGMWFTTVCGAAQ